MNQENEQQELIVRSESIQRMYEFFSVDRFRVNRRYQRKLVWNVDEKAKLIDSILQDIPLPLFLVAEDVAKSPVEYELIDGLQRLNAIFSFRENEYSLNGQYFDLDALADTKDLKDSGALTQKTPVMSRVESRRIANYSLALSVFRSADQGSVEEVFRRINSGGRRLSKQALRQAGTLSSLADLVRELSSEIRKDASLGNVVMLGQMPEISITNQGLDYGVDVEDIFWVRNGILRREDIRESLDEQLVLDILIDMLSHPVKATGTRIRNAAYAFGMDEEDNKTAAILESAIESITPEIVREQFLRTFEDLTATIDASGQKFSALVGAKTGGRAPRYYHVAFMAYYQLIYGENMRLSDRKAAATALNGSGNSTMKMPGGGGDWKVDSKTAAFNGVKGVIRGAFEPRSESSHASISGSATRLETVLRNSMIEQQLVELKQGLLSLGPKRERNSTLETRLAQTVSAIANNGPGSVGYLMLGIADQAEDARKIENLDQVQSINFDRYHLVGIEREAAVLGQSLAEYWDSLVRKFADNANLPELLRSQVGTMARLVNYSGLAVGMFEIRSLDVPALYGTEMYERRGSSTVKVSPDNYFQTYAKFAAAKG